MTACPDRLMLLHGLVDGELDAANSISIEAHLKVCSGCVEELRQLEELHTILAASALEYKTPEALRSRIETDIGRANSPTQSRDRTAGKVARAPWFAGGMATALAASLALFVAVPQLTASGTEKQLVASHVRSLLAGHLTDVTASNRHVVKPWFNGRIDFAPPVVELADAGFPLVGGRLDYFDGRVVPAIVYRRRLHSINLFVSPTDTFSSPVGITTSREGYSLVRWSENGLEFWAVSDIEVDELQQFHRLFVARVKTAQSR